MYMYTEIKKEIKKSRKRDIAKSFYSGTIQPRRKKNILDHLDHV